VLLRVQTEPLRILKRGRSAAYAAQQAIVLDRPSDLVLQIFISHSIPQLPRTILKDVIVHFFIETRLTHSETFKYLERIPGRNIVPQYSLPYFYRNLYLYNLNR